LCNRGNPFCIPDYSSSITSITQRDDSGQLTSTAAPAAPQNSGTQTGCVETTTCQENPVYLEDSAGVFNSAATLKYPNVATFNAGQPNSYYCPIQDCADVECSTKGSAATRNSGCVEKASTTCAITTESYSANNVNPKMYSTQSCNNCVARKITEKQTNPKITIPANENFNCYSFESYNKSANKFLSGYDLSGDSTAKSNFIASETAIVKVPPAHNFGSDNNFGNIQNFIVMDNKTSFLMKQSVSTNLLGNFKGFVVHNDNFKNAITSVDNIFGTTKIQFTKKGLFSNGQQLAVALCKEDTLGQCSAINLPANKYTEFIPYNPLQNNYFTFDSASGSIKRILASPISPLIGGGKCDSELMDEKFICFKGVVGEPEDEIKKYRLSFRIIDTDGDAGNNSGSYKVRIEKREALKSRAGGIVNGVLGPITRTMEGSLVDDANTVVDERIGLVQNFYVKLISNPLYKKLLTLSIVLALSFYGMGYLIGVNELKNSEIVKILLKIGFIYLFTSTETGIVYFNSLFVGFFKDAINYITFSVAETFDTANSNEIRIKIRDSSFYDKGILFKSADKVIDLLMTGAVQKKILALLFSSIFGWIYFLIIYYCLMTYIYAIANSMLLYITCQIMVSILFVLGPIFFIFLMFKVTKDMFDNWLKALIGFSLQQIFLVMTLSLFNTFVYSFLKLALGYRICWTNVLSLNLIISKVSLFNFWSVAGTNSPESGVEDSPDSSFGSDENMPSLYLFLYLMIVVSLMKKFIQMFTDLAVSLSGGLKASTISAEAMSGMKSAAGAISQQVGKAYQASVGRVVANIDNTLFDSGRIAKSRKASEREQFASNMMTRASLHKAGNDAVSKYKKENGLKLSNMSSAEQKSVLEDVRMKGIKEYASENDIGDKKLNSLLNKTGLDYNGSNLFGLAAQVAKQGVSSGGNLFTAVRDKKVETSFSKTEANAAIKKMKTPDQQNEFIENVKDGKVHVNKGKMEKARSFAISAVKEPVKAVLSPKATAKKIGGGVLSLGKSAIGMVVKSDPIKKEAVERLKESGQIAKFNIPIIDGAVPAFVKNWARTDEEKKIIRDKMRDVSREKGGDNAVNKVTSKAVVRDLELTAKHAQRLKTREGLAKDFAHVGRFKERVQNVLSPNPSEEYKKDREKDREERKNERDANPDRGMAKRAGKWLGGQFNIKKGIDNLYKNTKENFNKNKALEKNEVKAKMIDRLKSDNDKISLKNPESDRSKEVLKLTEDREKAKKGEDFIGKKLKDEFGDKTRFGLLKEMKEDLKNFDKNGRKFSEDFKNKINGLRDDDLKKGLQKDMKVIEGSKDWKENFGKILGDLSVNRKENYVDGLIKKEIAENPELKNVIDKGNEFRAQINEADAKIKNLGDGNIDKTNDIYIKALKINQDNVKKVADYEKEDVAGRAGMAFANKILPASNFISNRLGKESGREEYKKALKGVKEFNNLETTKDFEKFVKKDEKKDD
jgi:type IV secretory pathway VirB6-like protein